MPRPRRARGPADPDGRHGADRAAAPPLRAGGDADRRPCRAPRLRRPAAGPVDPRRSRRGNGRGQLRRRSRARTPTARPYTLVAADLRDRRPAVRRARRRHDVLATPRTAGDRHGPARGDPGGRPRWPPPIPTTPTATGSPGGPTSCGTKAPARSCSVGSAGRPTWRRSSNRSPARSTATSASRRRCIPSRTAPDVRTRAPRRSAAATRS